MAVPFWTVMTSTCSDCFSSFIINEVRGPADYIDDLAVGLVSVQTNRCAGFQTTHYDLSKLILKLSQVRYSNAALETFNRFFFHIQKIDDHCPDMWRGGIFGPRMVKSTPQLGVVYL